jgi:signal transduction histidine kinase
MTTPEPLHPNESTAASLQKERILVVDDHPTNREILRIILEEDYELVEAGNGEEAVELAATFKPGLILLDIMMPGIDGYETCRRMRALDEVRSAKIVMVSSRAMAHERIQGYKSGADDYITKPFSEQELLAKVRVYMQLRRVQEVDKMKSDVLQLLSHEFCTPLSFIKAPVELLLDGTARTPEDQTTLLEMIACGTDRLDALLRKVLTLCGLLAGQGNLAIESTSLATILRASLAQVVKKYQGRQISIEADLRTEGVVHGDPRRLQWIFEAILDNAGRFSRFGGSVQVELTSNSRECIVRVQDQGEGIPDGLIERVFEPFVCADIEMHTGGHGLSLAISRLILDQHAGHISVARAPSAGTIVTVTLPNGDSNTSQL